ncbi:hypothetical protein A2154_03020 [Candidatus Gottesmanbacteria bacterium RBG_16_43_7]|uniref:Glycosyltransferase RgtA/B/C/D-like domain-containing protein n=1 Tax=Candidatus Gottesmanbacteria bacterium RBG_16_43_7 TaxID=1798373 RepID=A0A1F5ZB94_9BACT|nr:MAG: hypothetical protein A2154_03020 [Candidatus Gottesmanbacteria bacterium RBG_16_43_7]
MSKSKNRVEIVTVTGLILIFTVLNLWHIIYSWLIRPAGSVFIGISHYHEDYFYYLSQVTQGALGNWKTENLFTTEPIGATLLWWVNIILGKISAFSGLYPWTVYTIALFVVTIISLLTLYWAALKIFPANRLLRISSYIISVFSSQYYILHRLPSGVIQINPVDFFYSYTKALNRLGGVVHLILQNILSLAIIVLFGSILSDLHQKKTNSRAFIGKVLTVSLFFFMLMFINPMYVAIDAICIALVSAWYVLIRPNRLLQLSKLAYATFVIGVPLLIPLSIILSAFRNEFYLYFRWAENQVRPTTPFIFFPSMGLIVPFIILGFVPYLKKGSAIRVLGLFWALFQIIIYLTPVPNRLLVPYFRIHQPPAYAFLAAVAAEGMLGISVIISKIIRKLSITTCLMSLVSIFLFFQLPMLYFEVTDRLHNNAYRTFLQYPSYKLIDGLLFLKSQPHERNAIAINNLEFLIPAVSGVRVFTAHRSLTWHYGDKIPQVVAFFYQSMPPESAWEFLNRNNIGYIIWNNLDGDGTKLASSYPFLVKLFENEAVMIYTMSSM